ncbi:antibiotic biosynthesis monooxygenase [Phaeobacter sp. HS012]|uniref:antibiotic biosynthesis monooxygenase family protein n=1 Tax=unclassified Phaeobacter TaxID=2621772 RepID=UPI001B35EA35|nr:MULTISPECIES: antibiotic biosynthesis monooxygenase [unclassified Phaeobacter]MBQ4807948.1 antibiotic biosynthesis monooxygenase [Phaeobacter sp. HS012]MBQ4882797.1 antibiotic biosynthesis monooxygenase [Phaeobacter sp. HS011]
MIAVIFEVEIKDGAKDRYLEIAADLKPLLQEIEGFISVERFQSLTAPGKLLSLSFWESEEAVANWRRLSAHRAGQAEGRESVFSDYRLRVAGVLRDYGMERRDEAPADARAVHDPVVT